MNCQQCHQLPFTYDADIRLINASRIHTYQLCMLQFCLSPVWGTVGTHPSIKTSNILFSIVMPTFGKSYRRMSLSAMMIWRGDQLLNWYKCDLNNWIILLTEHSAFIMLNYNCSLPLSSDCCNQNGKMPIGKTVVWTFKSKVKFPILNRLVGRKFPQLINDSF